MNEALVIDQDAIKGTIEKTLTSKKVKNFGKTSLKTLILLRLCQNSSDRA